MRRFWFDFDFENYYKIPNGLKIGCGVTAYNYQDAIGLMEEKIFKGKQFPTINNVVENIDVSTLDKGHILPNMKPPNMRGIWFPIGYD
jgi:hypothetical protein